MRYAPLLIGLLLLAVGCAPEALPPADTPMDDDRDDGLPTDGPGDDTAERAPASFRYADGTLYWNATVQKPSPCHTVTVEERVMESFPVQIAIDIATEPPSGDLACAQVITPETVNGSIQVGHVPGSVTIDVAGQGTVRSDDIEDRSA